MNDPTSQPPPPPSPFTDGDLKRILELTKSMTFGGSNAAFMEGAAAGIQVGPIVFRAFFANDVLAAANGLAALPPDAYAIAYGALQRFVEFANRLEGALPCPHQQQGGALARMIDAEFPDTIGDES